MPKNQATNKPTRIVEEFGPDLAVLMCIIFKGVVNLAKWPSSWKYDFTIPLQKSQDPKTEDDLRMISLTAIFSKVL